MRDTNEHTEISKTEKTQSDWKYTLTKYIILSDIILLLILFLYCLWYRNEMKWFIIITCAPTFLERIVDIYKSLGVVENLARYYVNGKLSLKEIISIKYLAYVIVFIGGFRFEEIIFEEITGLTNVVLRDAFTALYWVVMLYLYYFFICALLPEIMHSLIQILKWLYRITPAKNAMMIFGNALIENMNEVIYIRPFSIRALENINGLNKYVRRMMYVVIIVLFIMDIFIQLICILADLILNICGYAVKLYRLISNTVNRFCGFCESISDKRIVFLSIRIALVFSFVSIVAVNRYEPIFDIQEASTAMLEFIASVVVIPVVFDWISSHLKV